MSILLVNPPYSLEDRYGRNLKSFGGNAEPLGLAYLAASVRQAGYDVSIVDAPVEDYSSVQVAEIVRDRGSSLVGITMLTPMFGRVRTLVRDIRSLSPDTVIVLGGAHPTAMPEETLEEIDCDIVCIGEGETTFTEIADAVISRRRELRSVDGICFREEGTVTRTPPRPFQEDLDLFPPPARDLLPMSRYFLTATRIKGTGYCGTLIAARGCPFNCSFCSHPFGRSFRKHSIPRIISEMKELIEVYGADQINIEADTLTIDREFILSLCDGIMESGLNGRFKWTCESRVDTLDMDVLRRMKAAGCWQVSIGVESGSDRLLKEITKGETTEQIERGFRMIREVGISIRGFFMLGLPGETREESIRTIDFARRLDPDWAQFTITIPYPGTPLFERLKADGSIRSYNWDYYRTWGGWTEETIPYVTGGRTVEELKAIQKYAVRRFYLRFRVLWRMVRSIDSLKTFSKLVRGFVILLRSKFS